MDVPLTIPLVVEEHEVAPPVPEIVHVNVPVGAAAPVDPFTVAVKIADPPSVGVLEVVTITLGVALAITVAFVDVVVDTGLYDESPAKVKVAEYVPATGAPTLHV